MPAPALRRRLRRRRLVGARRSSLAVRRLVGLVIVGGAVRLWVKLEGTQRRHGAANAPAAAPRARAPSKAPAGAHSSPPSASRAPGVAAATASQEG